MQPVKWAALSSDRGGLTQFTTREAAERHSVSWHGHDSVFQVGRGGFLDSTGAQVDAAAARLALVEAAEASS